MHCVQHLRGAARVGFSSCGGCWGFDPDSACHHYHPHSQCYHISALVGMESALMGSVESVERNLPMFGVLGKSCCLGSEEKNLRCDSSG